MASAFNTEWNQNCPASQISFFLARKLLYLWTGASGIDARIIIVSPRANADFWENKISNNIARDRAVNAELETVGWSVIRTCEQKVKNDLAACVCSVRKAVRYADSIASSHD